MFLSALYIAIPIVTYPKSSNVLNRSLRPLVMALVPGQQKSLDKLKAKREELANEVAAIINEYGPRLYDDFDQVSSDFSQFVQLDANLFSVADSCPFGQCSSLHRHTWTLAQEERNWGGGCTRTRAYSPHDLVGREIVWMEQKRPSRH